MVFPKKKTISMTIFLGLSRFRRGCWSNSPSTTSAAPFIEGREGVALNRFEQPPGGGWFHGILMGKSPFLMGKSPFLMGKSPFLMGKSPFLMGKSTISTGPFSIANC